ncbi:MAG: hypothetical protein WBM86_23030 [Waterburya sp.]
MKSAIFIGDKLRHYAVCQLAFNFKPIAFEIFFMNFNYPRVMPSAIFIAEKKTLTRQ